LNSFKELFIHFRNRKEQNGFKSALIKKIKNTFQGKE